MAHLDSLVAFRLPKSASGNKRLIFCVNVYVSETFCLCSVSKTSRFSFLGFAKVLGQFVSFALYVLLESSIEEHVFCLMYIVFAQLCFFSGNLLWK